MARRASLQESKLSKRDLGICRRIREAREVASVTQNGLAELVGIPRDRLSSYEKGRAPIKFDLALRICRQLVINEEWLATGETETLDQVARERLRGKGSLKKIQKEIFLRQCVDLQSEPIAHAVAPGALFSAAFDRVLLQRYRELAAQFFDFPRIVFVDDIPEPKLAGRLIEVIFYRQLTLLRQLAEDVHKIESWPVERQFTRGVFELSMKAFQELAFANNFDLPSFRSFIEAVKNMKRSGAPKKPLDRQKASPV